MRKHDLRLHDYLGHMLQAIERIEHYVSPLTQESFQENSNIQAQDAVIRNLEILGEAANNIRQHHAEFASQNSHIPWEDVYQMRNQIAHGYFAVDLVIVWKVIERDLPELKAQISALPEIHSQ